MKNICLAFFGILIVSAFAYWGLYAFLFRGFFDFISELSGILSAGVASGFLILGLVILIKMMGPPRRTDTHTKSCSCPGNCNCDTWYQ